MIKENKDTLVRLTNVKRETHTLPWPLRCSFNLLSHITHLYHKYFNYINYQANLTLCCSYHVPYDNRSDR